MRLREGRKVLWDALVWQRRPGNRKRKVHKSQARISFISNPSASALMMLQAKNKAAYAAPVPVEGQWLSEQGSHHCPICQSHLACPRNGTVPWGDPLMWAWCLMEDSPTSSHASPAAAQGEPTPSEAVEKEIVPFNDLAPVTQT